MAERVKVVRVTLDIETTERHPEPLKFEFYGRLNDDFFDNLESTIKNEVLKIFS